MKRQRQRFDPNSSPTPTLPYTHPNSQLNLQKSPIFFFLRVVDCIFPRFMSTLLYCYHLFSIVFYSSTNFFFLFQLLRIIITVEGKTQAYGRGLEIVSKKCARRQMKFEIFLKHEKYDCWRFKILTDSMGARRKGEKTVLSWGKSKL